MDIRLKPELERMIQQDLERGPYQSIDEFVERAVVMLHEQETWCAENAAELNRKVAQGLESARNGRLLDPHEVESAMIDRKRDWLSKER